MRFVDEAVIEVSAGDGGDGLVAFRRESKVPLGGSSGGDGGRGGDVVLVADPGTTTLLDHRYRRIYQAEGGAKGGSSGKTGRGGGDLEIPVPPGTTVIDEETGAVLVDLVDPGQRAVLARGGKGGLGNIHFKRSTRQAPRIATDGKPGGQCTVRLSLKLMADVGLVGLPNAGKSTFIRAVSRSQAVVADYPFTTLVPNLGVARVDERTLVLADIPGLVEGAHRGEGLGDRFLKHVERTRVLIHLVSLSPDAPDPLEAYDTIRGELTAHAAELATRPQIVVLNKIDVIEDRYELELWSQAFADRDVEVMAASGLSGENVREVLRRAVVILDETRGPGDTAQEPWSPI